MPIPAGPGSPAGVPDWAPTRHDIADYVPHRTLVVAESSILQSQDTYRLTFDGTTRPTGDAVDRLIGRAAATVAVRVAPMAAASEGAATTVVCLMVAAWVERGWPEDDVALQRASDLEKQSASLLDDLVATNDAANDDGTGDYGIDVAAMWVEYPVSE